MERKDQLKQAEDTLRKQTLRIIQEYDLTVSDLAGILETIKMTFILNAMMAEERFVDQFINIVKKRQQRRDES